MSTATHNTKPEDADGHPDPCGYFQFWSHGRSYAVALESVDQVIRMDRLIPIPFVPPTLLGLGLLRRDAMPVFVLEPDHPMTEPSTSETPTKVTATPWTATHPSEEGSAHEPAATDPERPVVLVLRGTMGRWGLAIDRRQTNVREGRAPESGTPAPGYDAAIPGATGWVRHGDRISTLLDVDAAWSGHHAQIQWRYQNPLTTNPGEPAPSSEDELSTDLWPGPDSKTP